MQRILKQITAFCLLLLFPALSSAAPVPRQIEVTPELYAMVHGLGGRDEPKHISVNDCKEQRTSGFEFCAEGRNLCESRDDHNNRKWEWIDGSNMSCPPTGWAGNPSIASIKISSRSVPSATASDLYEQPAENGSG